MLPFFTRVIATGERSLANPRLMMVIGSCLIQRLKQSGLPVLTPENEGLTTPRSSFSRSVAEAQESGKAMATQEPYSVLPEGMREHVQIARELL